MSRFVFDVADRGDDAAMRSFLRSTTMPGRVQLAFLREPSYFAPGGRFGSFHQTIVCRDTAPPPSPGSTADESSEVVGLGCRSVRDVHLDGRPTPVGYLSMLRSAERVRSGLLLARGYRYLRELHADGAAPCYLTTIAEGNEVAHDVLTSGRAGLPRYRPAGRYLTFAVAARAARRRRGSEEGQRLADDHEEVIRFLGSHGKSRQFYPVIERADFDGAPPHLGPASPCFAGIGLDDIAIRRDDDGRIVATMALWDQRSFRQTVIRGYGPTLHRLRPAHNATRWLHRRPRLPEPGSTLQEGYVALTAIENDDADTADGLLGDLLGRANGRGLDYVLFGCHEDDPLASVAAQRAFLTYTTRVFVVTWSDLGAEPDYDPTIPIHLEVGCL